jgi:hypothetical protein
VITSVLGIGTGNLNWAIDYFVGMLSGLTYFYLLTKKVETIGAKYSVRYLNNNNNNNNNNNTADNNNNTAVSDSLSGPIDASNNNSNNNNNKKLLTSIFDRYATKLATFRFFVPVILLLLLSVKDRYLPTDLLDLNNKNNNHEYYLLNWLNIHNEQFDQWFASIHRTIDLRSETLSFQPFHFLSTSAFLTAMAGFFTIRLSILIQEAGKEFRARDIIEILPGSVAIYLRQFLNNNPTDNNNNNNNNNEPQEIFVPKKLVFFTGPVVAGREELLDRVVRDINNNNKINAKKLKLIVPRIINNNNDKNSNINDDYYYSGIDRDRYGQLVQV